VSPALFIWLYGHIYLYAMRWLFVCYLPTMNLVKLFRDCGYFCCCLVVHNTVFIERTEYSKAEGEIPCFILQCQWSFKQFPLCQTQPHHFVSCLRKFAAILGLPGHPRLAAREGFLPPDWPWLAINWGTTDQTRTVTNFKERRPTRCSQETTP